MLREGSRAEKAAYNFIWLVANSVIMTVMPFIVRTLLIHYWGMDYVGLNSLFASIVRAFSITELGIGQALVFAMYKPAADGDIGSVNAILNTCRKVCIGFGIATLVIGICAIPFLPNLISGDYPSDVSLTGVYLIYLANTVLSYFVCGYWQNIFSSHQSGHFTYKARLVVMFLMYALQCIIIVACHNYYWYILLLPVSTVAANIADYYLVRKYYPQYHPEGRLNREFYQELGSNIGGLLVRRARTLVRDSFNGVVISAVLGVVALAKYQNYVLIYAVPMILMNSFREVILQGFGNSVASEDLQQNTEVVKHFTFLTEWIGTWTAGVLLCLYNPFMEVWAGKDNIFDMTTVTLFVVYYYVVNLTYINDMVRNGIGIWWQGKWVPIVEAILNIILDIVLVQFWGVAGILLATIFTMLVVNLPGETWCLNRYYLKGHTVKQLISYLANGIVAMLCIASCMIVCSRVHGGFLFVLVVRAILATVIVNIIWFAVHCKDKYLWKTLHMLRSIVK